MRHDVHTIDLLKLYSYQAKCKEKSTPISIHPALRYCPLIYLIGRWVSRAGLDADVSLWGRKQTPLLEGLTHLGTDFISAYMVRHVGGRLARHLSSPNAAASQILITSNPSCVEVLPSGASPVAGRSAFADSDEGFREACGAPGIGIGELVGMVWPVMLALFLAGANFIIVFPFL